MASKREQLIQAATRLFAEQGYRATGIDQISEVAGVTKKTLYHHFRSKDELVLACLRDYEGRYRNNFMRMLEAVSPEPRERLLALFDLAGQWFASDRFYGCLFINAVAEHAAADSPLRVVCQEFKRLERRYIRELAEAAGVPDPDGLATSLALLFEGAIVTAQVSGSAESAANAKKAAEVLLEHAMRPQGIKH